MGGGKVLLACWVVKGKYLKGNVCYLKVLCVKAEDLVGVMKKKEGWLEGEEVRELVEGERETGTWWGSRDLGGERRSRDLGGGKVLVKNTLKGMCVSGRVEGEISEQVDWVCVWERERSRYLVGEQRLGRGRRRKHLVGRDRDLGGRKVLRLVGWLKGNALKVCVSGRVWREISEQVDWGVCGRGGGGQVLVVGDRYLWWGETEELWGRRADTLGGGQVVGRGAGTG